MATDITGPRSGSSTSGPSAGSECPAELPVIDVGVVRERADAARNRLKVLAAAEKLFNERGVAATTMDEIAATAGVGKGTVYRRFKDKAGLGAALLDERERELQAGLLYGPPPLGPGAAATDRLAAFCSAYLAYVDRYLDLVLMSQTATRGARLRTGSHRFWRQHCRVLLAGAGAPDPQMRADTLLAALAAEQVHHWRHDEHRSLAEIIETVDRMCRSLCAQPGCLCVPGDAPGPATSTPPSPPSAVGRSFHGPSACQ